MASSSPRTVTVVDYDPSWPAIFEDLRVRIAEPLRGIALSIEHVGSTSVPGLASKPIIDMDVVIRSRDDLPAAIAALSTLGYRHSGNLGIEGREAFVSPALSPAHHLYVCAQGAGALLHHLALRDHLRRDPAAAAAYGQLKRQLAERFPHDIESYLAAKTDFLVAMLRTAGMAHRSVHEVPTSRSP